ncbi:hypothetical protein DFH06DRAFT_1210263 [Mycena polygramma]|nr:hypothetical protein DFH06DRAFT_1210263 [Mycena polygramma]
MPPQLTVESALSILASGPMSLMTIPSDLVVTWASRALISSAAIFMYDFALTFTNEIELYRHSGRDRKLLWSFLALRYFPALYQFLMLFAVIFNNPTFQSCSALDKAALALDTSFQLSYIAIICWRVKVINGSLVAIPLAILGLSSPIINIAVSNPSVFPQCRILNPTPTARITTILPCLRAVFDAVTTLALLAKLWRHIATMGALASNTVSFVITEEVKDIILIFAIMTLEAVFVQIPSARNHARNFVIPFIDSLTAILATRFMLELEERSRNHGRSRRTSTARLPSDTLVGSEVPVPAPTLDDSSSLNTVGTRSIGWNRIGSCLGARAF